MCPTIPNFQRTTPADLHQTQAKNIIVSDLQHHYERIICELLDSLFFIIVAFMYMLLQSLPTPSPPRIELGSLLHVYATDVE